MMAAPRWHIPTLIAVLAVGAALRIHDLTLGGLWMDELWAATYVQLGLKDLLVAVIRFDVHPPSYYMQMNVWSAVFGRSDAALLANSVAWSLLTIVAVWFAAGRILCPTTGLIAACLAAVSGSEVYYGQELRMYAMIGALTPAAWYLAERYAREPRWGRAFWLVVLLVPLALAHGASVVPISCVVIYLVLRLGIRDSVRPRHLALFVAMGLVALPAVVNSMFRGVSHTQVPDAATIGATLAGWLFGYHPPLAGWAIVVGALIVTAATAAALLDPSSRRTVLSFIVWPVAFVLIVSVVLRPIWIARLMAFCAPFACVALAVALVRLGTSLRIPALTAGAVVVVLMTALSLGQGSDGRKMEYREAAAFLRDNARPGDLILVPEHVAFWGIARYFAGPSWGNLLTIQDPIRPGESRAWDPVYARLGADWLRWLNLIPDRRMIEAQGNRMMIGHSPDPAMRQALRIWVVGSNRVRPEELDLCVPAPEGTSSGTAPANSLGTTSGLTQFRGLAVHHRVCAGNL